MFSIARWIPRLACGMVLLACADSTDPIAPGDAASAEVPQLSVEGGGLEPSPEELAEMPAEFRKNATLLDYWTDVGFLPADSRTYAQGFMRYFGTNATQDVKLDLRFENRQIASRTAYGENSDLFPYVRTLWTTALLGVSGSCGHLADGATVHKAWHQFFGSGWKFFSWGTAAGTSADADEQVSCAPPPPPSGGGNTDYDTGCQLCTQWLYIANGRLVDVWWECEPIDAFYCGGLQT